MRRARIFIVIGFAAFVFLAIALLLARSLSATGTERDAVLQVARAEARGDVAAVLARTPTCAADRACAATTRAFASRLERAGDVQILRYDASVELPLTRQVNTARVAWRAGSGLPVVQCVRVRRDGPLTGAGVQLLSVSAPIGGEASCP